MSENEGSRPIAGTVGIFLLYTVLAIGLSVVLSIVSKVPPNTGMRVAISIAAAVLAGQHFCKQFGSPPVGAEIRNLVLGSLGALWLIGLTVIAAIFASSGGGFAESFGSLGFNSETAVMSAVVFVVANIVYGGILWISYGPLTRWMFNRSKST